MSKYNGFSDKTREILEARDQAEQTLEQEGITYNFDLMEWVDQDGNVVPGEEIGPLKKHLIEQLVERKIDW